MEQVRIYQVEIDGQIYEIRTTSTEKLNELTQELRQNIKEREQKNEQ